MSRKINVKICVSGTLVAKTPISVGGMGGGDHVDLELAVDGSGAYCIPGTSLAGPMRVWLRENADSEIDDKIFGPLIGEKDRGRTDDDGRASAVYIDDSRVVGGVFRERRHGIAIDAKSGATKDGSLYTRALLARGTRFPLKMELDIAGDDSDAEAALGGILSALQRCEIRFGACKTRGMGLVELVDLKVDRYDFIADRDALDRWLDGERSSTSGGVDVLPTFVSEGTAERIEMDIRWSAVSPIMVKSGRDGIEADMLPLMSGVGYGHIAPVIPGSSLKGVLRAQAERILNTIFENDKAAENSLIKDLFGSQDNAGLLSVDDVYYNTESDIKLIDWLSEEKLNDTPTEHHQYVAIDRFTGGASDGALFSARPVKASAEWEPIHIALRLPKCASDSSRRTAAALVRLLLRDMRDGYITIGFGSRRGMGEIKANIDAALLEMENRHLSAENLQPEWDEFVSTNGASYERMIAPKDSNKEGDR